jgi:hypothetical protein
MIEASLEKGRREVPGDLGSAPFGGDASHEPLHVDDEALVGALTDMLSFVVGLDPEDQSTPIAFSEGRRKVTRMPIGVAAR